MTDKSYFRAEKNENIAARDETHAKEIDERKEVKNPLNDPTHWRYKKSQNIKHGTTSARDMGLAPKEKPKEEAPKEVETKKVEGNQTEPAYDDETEKKLKEVTYTAAGAKKLNRAEQVKILNKRGIKVYSSDKEAVLVKNIVSSNPK